MKKIKFQYYNRQALVLVPESGSEKVEIFLRCDDGDDDLDWMAKKHLLSMIETLLREEDPFSSLQGGCTYKVRQYTYLIKHWGQQTHRQGGKDEGLLVGTEETLPVIELIADNEELHGDDKGGWFTCDGNPVEISEHGVVHLGDYSFYKEERVEVEFLHRWDDEE